jgi:hypothetical protein
MVPVACVGIALVVGDSVASVLGVMVAFVSGVTVTCVPGPVLVHDLVTMPVVLVVSGACCYTACSNSGSVAMMPVA